MLDDVATTTVFGDYEDDARAEAGGFFRDLVASYFAEAGAGEGPVSTPHAFAALDARFDEALPSHGRPLADVVARVRRDVLVDANRLAHPMSMGHQVSAPLPAAVLTDGTLTSGGAEQRSSSPRAPAAGVNPASRPTRRPPHSCLAGMSPHAVSRAVARRSRSTISMRLRFMQRTPS